MARCRWEVHSPEGLERLVELERRALRALVRRLLEQELPYERVKRLCYQVQGDLVGSGRGAADERAALEALVSEALAGVGELIDEMTAKRDEC